MAQSIGINTSQLFALTFALGSGLAALGGALGADFLRSSPGYALDHLVYFLIVVAVGGLGSIRGPFVAALLLGIADTAFKYHRPRARRLLHLCADHGDPAVAAARPVRARVMASRRPTTAAARSMPSRAATACGRSRRCPGCVAIAAYFVFPDYLALGAQILATILFGALARSRARLCRHRHARPCRLLRHRRLYGRHPGGAWLGRADQRASRRRHRRRGWSGSSPAP